MADPEDGGSKADYYDLHAYTDFGSLSRVIEDFGISSNRKPVVMGEYGTSKNSSPNIDKAKSDLVGWQAESCKQKNVGENKFNGFDGWIYWFWGTASRESNFYSATDEGVQIGKELSPKYRNNPCSETYSNNEGGSVYTEKQGSFIQNLFRSKKKNDSPTTIEVKQSNNNSKQYSRSINGDMIIVEDE